MESFSHTSIHRQIITLLNQIDDALIIFNLSDNIEFINQYVESLTGYLLAEVQAKPIDFLFNKIDIFDSKPYKKKHNNHYLSGIISLKNKTELHITGRVFSLSDETGNTIGQAITFHYSTSTTDYSFSHDDELSTKYAKPHHNPINVFRFLPNAYAVCKLITYNNEPADFIFKSANAVFSIVTGLADIAGHSASYLFPEIFNSYPDFAELISSAVKHKKKCSFDFYAKHSNILLNSTIYGLADQCFLFIINTPNKSNSLFFEWDTTNRSIILTEDLLNYYPYIPGTPYISFDDFCNCISPQYRERVINDMHYALINKDNFILEWCVTDKDGYIQWFINQGIPIRNSYDSIDRYVIICDNITELKATNNDDIVSTNSIDILLNSGMELLCMISTDGEILNSNTDTWKYIFRDSSPSTEKNIFRFITQQHLTIEQCSHNNISFCPFDYFNKCNIRITISPIYNTTGKIDKFAIFSSNDNNLNTHEQLDRKSTKIYQTLISASPDSIITTDLQGNITSISDIGIEMYGTNNKGELVGLPFSTIVLPDEVHIINEILETTLQEGLIQNREITLRKKNNTFYPAEISSALIQNDTGKPSACMMIVRDISKRKIIERELFHAKRLIYLGKMASSIAHEIYQPINNIGLIIDKILMETAANSPTCHDYIKYKSDRIFENISRIQTIIDNILIFSKTNKNFISSTVNINDAIKNSFSLFNDKCQKQSIQLILESDNDNLFISGNSYKFEQVIINMTKNSIYALEEKKRVTNTDYDMKITVHTYTIDNNIYIRFEDSGIGIPSDDLEYIMHPFFSTKDPGEGTGLGLSICYGIINEMNGTIKIDSISMQGTTILITLPKKPTLAHKVVRH